ncbi:hypothetical protein CCP3SC15_420007 [Gammaproteobacteria bacterium]
MTGECNRCGKCCRVLPFQIAGMSPEYKKYLLNRGLEETQGFILVPHTCQHLTMVSVPLDLDIPSLLITVHSCKIHESPDRPKVCQRFKGQKQIGPWKIYVPPGCGYSKTE